MEYRVDDRALSAAQFLAFVQQVWPGDYDAARTQEALRRTLNLTAYDGAVITCFDSEAEQCTLNLIQRANLPVCILGDEHEGVPSIGATSTPRNTA